MCEICLLVTPLRSHTIQQSTPQFAFTVWLLLSRILKMLTTLSTRTAVPSLTSTRTDWFFVACKLSVGLSLYKQSLFMCNYSWVCSVDLQLLGCLVPARVTTGEVPDQKHICTLEWPNGNGCLSHELKRKLNEIQTFNKYKYRARSTPDKEKNNSKQIFLLQRLSKLRCSRDLLSLTWTWSTSSIQTRIREK